MCDIKTEEILKVANFKQRPGVEENRRYRERGNRN